MEQAVGQPNSALSLPGRTDGKTVAVIGDVPLTGGVRRLVEGRIRRTVEAIRQFDAVPKPR